MHKSATVCQEVSIYVLRAVDIVLPKEPALLARAGRSVSGSDRILGSKMDN